jgi:hypothetical protein
MPLPLEFINFGDKYGVVHNAQRWGEITRQSGAWDFYPFPNIVLTGPMLTELAQFIERLGATGQNR